MARRFIDGNRGKMFTPGNENDFRVFRCGNWPQVPCCAYVYTGDWVTPDGILAFVA